MSISCIHLYIHSYRLKTYIYNIIWDMYGFTFKYMGLIYYIHMQVYIVRYGFLAYRYSLRYRYAEEKRIIYIYIYYIHIYIYIDITLLVVSQSG